MAEIRSNIIRLYISLAWVHLIITYKTTYYRVDSYQSRKHYLVNLFINWTGKIELIFYWINQHYMPCSYHYKQNKLTYACASKRKNLRHLNVYIITVLLSSGIFDWKLEEKNRCATCSKTNRSVCLLASFNSVMFCNVAVQY